MFNTCSAHVGGVVRIVCKKQVSLKDNENSSLPKELLLRYSPRSIQQTFGKPIAQPGIDFYLLPSTLRWLGTVRPIASCFLRAGFPSLQCTIPKVLSLSLPLHICIYSPIIFKFIICHFPILIQFLQYFPSIATFLFKRNLLLKQSTTTFFIFHTFHHFVCYVYTVSALWKLFPMEIAISVDEI